MRAALFLGPGKPLEVTEIPVPVPGPGDVLVRVAGCGFCHTDLHYMDHGVPTVKKPPMVLGHEISGEVAESGAGAWKRGDRVLVPAVLPCGRCGLCRSGRENICPEMRMPGNHIDGGFAEFIVVPAKDLVRLPVELDLVDSCIIADALSTPFHAVVSRAKVAPGEWVAIVGCGGVGMNAVQFAAAAGAHVVAIDVKPHKLELARELGAAETVNPVEVKDVGKEVKRLTGGGADAAVEAVGSPMTIDSAFSTLRRGGRLVLVGYSDKPAELPAARMMFFEYTVLGSLGCPPSDYPRIVEMVRRNRIRLKPVIDSRIPLEEVNRAADDLRKGDTMRSVVVP